MRTTFLIDGFNLYHSFPSSHPGYRWLNLRALCEDLIRFCGRDAKLEDIYYFSALAEHKRCIDPNTVHHHKKYIKCLESTGVKIQLGRFGRMSGKRFEEKETDVNIALKSLELCYEDEADIIVFITGDSDQKPSMSKIRERFPQKRAIAMFPPRRKSEDLIRVAYSHNKISEGHILDNQFTSVMTLDNGKRQEKPEHW